jgi:hypothetical protein
MSVTLPCTSNTHFAQHGVLYSRDFAIFFNAVAVVVIVVVRSGSVNVFTCSSVSSLTTCLYYTKLQHSTYDYHVYFCCFFALAVTRTRAIFTQHACPVASTFPLTVHTYHNNCSGFISNSNNNGRNTRSSSRACPHVT